MKVKVNNNCIGCGACQALVPDIFEINDDGVAEAKNELIPDEVKDEVKDAKENCPVGAIEIKEA